MSSHLIKERSHVTKFSPSPIFGPLLFIIVSMNIITDRMGDKPIQPVIQPVTIDTMLN